MIEVEMKAKINDKVKTLEKIKEIGGTYSHTEKQHDIYFNAPDKNFKETDEALRIREIPEDDDFSYGFWFQPIVTLEKFEIK